MENFMEVYFLISSYKRSEKQSTIEMLHRLGVPRKYIILTVQTEEDLKSYEQYRHLVGKLVYRPCKNLAGNRNTALKSVPRGKRILVLDDDILDICYLHRSAGKTELLPIDTSEKFQSFLRTGFSIAAKCKAPGFSVYPVCNDYFMSTSYTPVSLAEGTLVGWSKSGSELYDENFSVKEDYEISCRNINKYNSLPRLNNFSCKARHYTKGGCDEWWRDNKTNFECAESLCLKYPHIVKKNPRRPGEVKMAHPVKPVKYHWKYER